MLKPIHPLSCFPALTACQQMMQCFALWLCESTTTNTTITKANLQPPTLNSAVEAEWLWDFLQKVEDRTSLLDQAKTIASMNAIEKAALRNWVDGIAALHTLFGTTPNPWPTNDPAISKTNWNAFKTLMKCFYSKALKSGLPYLPNGTPTATGGTTYASFVSEFRIRHRVNADPNAREVCVLCGGPLGNPEVDHWIAQGAYPLMSVSADNLLPICGECNSTSNKGEKPVYSNGSFAEWFHPYLRPANGVLQLGYDLATLKVTCSATLPHNQPKADNLDKLLNLSDRWTKEYKAEYAKHQDTLRRREQRRRDRGSPGHTQDEIEQFIDEIDTDLEDSSEPHREVHQLLCSELLKPVRLRAWHTELTS